MSIKCIWSNVSLKAFLVDFLSEWCVHFYLDDVFIDVNGVLKSPTIIALLSISPFMAVKHLPYILRCSYIEFISVEYIFFSSWSFYHHKVPFFVFCYSLCFKVDFQIEVLLLLLSYHFCLHEIYFPILSLSVFLFP